MKKHAAAKSQLSTLNSQLIVGIPCLMVGGTEMQTLRLVEALAACGCSCVTVCYFEHDSRMVQMFEQTGSKVVCLSSDGSRPHGSIKVFTFLWRRLRQVVRESRPQMAWVQYMAPGAIPLVVLRCLGVRRIIATLHTDADIYRGLGLIRFLQRRVADMFTCVTETAERHFFGGSHLIDSTDGMGRHIHCTLPNCLPKDVDVALRVAQEGTDSPQFTVGFVARLEPIKGADLVLPAFALVREKLPEARLVVVGDGSMRGRMEQQQRDMGIDDVEWVGRVDYSQLAQYYSRMTLVWMPSRSEGFGLSAVEAMACGIPVVATAVGGLKETVVDGISGLHVEPGNVAELAARTVELLQSPERRAAMSVGAIATAKKYTFEKYKERVSLILSTNNKTKCQE